METRMTFMSRIKQEKMSDKHTKAERGLGEPDTRRTYRRQDEQRDTDYHT